MDHPEIRIGVAARLIEPDVEARQPVLEPVLKMKFLVAGSLSLDQLATADALNTGPKNFSSSHPERYFRSCWPSTTVVIFPAFGHLRHHGSEIMDDGRFG